jgi:hypothetical protein
VEYGGSQLPIPTTALVTEANCSIALATSGWRNITAAVVASGTIIGA